MALATMGRPTGANSKWSENYAIGYRGVQYYLSTDGLAIVSTKDQYEFDASRTVDGPRKQEIFVSPPNVWVSRDPQAVMAAIEKGYKQQLQAR